MPARVGGAEAGCGGALLAGLGLGARFLAFALLAGFAFFIPFFMSVGAARFTFLDFFTFAITFRFFAMISLAMVRLSSHYNQLKFNIRDRRNKQL